MIPESPLTARNEFQTVEIQELGRKNKQLVIKLQDAATEVARLSMVVKYGVSLPDTRR